MTGARVFALVAPSSRLSLRNTISARPALPAGRLDGLGRRSVDRPLHGFGDDLRADVDRQLALLTAPGTR